MLAAYQAGEKPPKENKSSTFAATASVPDRKAMAAAAAAAAAARSQQPSRQISTEEKLPQRPSNDLSQSGSFEKLSQPQPAKEPESSSSQKLVKVKVRRKVSFTEKEPIIIDGGGGEEASTAAAEDARRRRKKERGEAGKKRRGRDRSQEYAIKEERRRSQPLGEELFLQVSTKLRAIEREREEAEQQVLQETLPAVASAPKRQMAAAMGGLEVWGAFGGDSPTSSQGATSSECSPPQKPRGNRMASLDANPAASCFAFGAGTSPSSAASTSGGVRLRERKPSSSDSRSSSKRSSLDGKTVAGLAQDLAAECAKAFALMESSLSKLSNDFGGKVMKESEPECSLR